MFKIYDISCIADTPQRIKFTQSHPNHCQKHRPIIVIVTLFYIYRIISILLLLYYFHKYLRKQTFYLHLNVFTLQVHTDDDCIEADLVVSAINSKSLSNILYGLPVVTDILSTLPTVHVATVCLEYPISSKDIPQVILQFCFSASSLEMYHMLLLGWVMSFSHVLCDRF